MKPRYVTAFAVIAALLVATAPPATASHANPTVVSSHTTDSDFNDATLTNMTVVGSGESATVELEQSNPTEDGVIMRYNYESGSGDVTDRVESHDGSVSGATFNSSALIDDFSMDFDGTSDFVEIEGDEATAGTAFSDDFTSTGLSFSTKLELRATDDQTIWVGDGAQTGWAFEVVSQKLQLTVASTGSNPQVSGSTTLSTGVTNTVGFVYYPGNDTAKVFLNGSEDGSGSAGDENNPQNENRLGDGGSAGVPVGGDLDGRLDETQIYNTSLTQPEMQNLSDLTSTGKKLPAEYINNHSATNTVEGFANISTADNVTITAAWRGDSNDDGSYDTLLNETSGITTAANHSFEWNSFAGNDVQINITVESTGSSEAFVLESEGVLANTSAPAVNNSSATPTGTLDTSSPTLEIDVNDSDFPLAQSDSVDVEFFVDNVSEGTTTLTSNGTASLETSQISGGDHKWNVSATDSYGHETNSEFFSITAPANLTIRNETPSPHNTVQGCTADVKFYEGTEDDPTIVERTDSDQDGNISLTGLPVGSTFVAAIECSGYHDRVVLIDGIFEQDSAFLLNKDNESDFVAFEIVDEIGDYTGKNTEIQVQKAINRTVYDPSDSGGFQWTAISGDRIGAEGSHSVFLHHNQRYRLKLNNSAGEVRILGEYRAEENETVTLRPTAPGINASENESYVWNATASNDGSTITFELDDPDSETTNLNVTFREFGNESNYLNDPPGQTVSGPIGYTKITQTVTGDDVNKTWVVDWSADRGGETIGGKRVVGKRVQEVVPELDDTWQHAIAAIVIILTGALFSAANVEVGAITTGMVAGGFWMVGWLPIEAGGPIMAAVFIVIVYKVSRQREAIG